LTINCIDCGLSLEIPEDAIDGEIIGCPDCGLDYVASPTETGSMMLTELVLEGEDWGE
jgi:alpha-aminoadipate carrier protein LysW